MQLLFLILLGGIVSFVLYLSYDKHVSDKKKANNSDDDLKIDLNKYSELTDNSNQTKEEIIEKVENVKEDSLKDEEIVKFQARRTVKKIEEDDEEII